MAIGSFGRRGVVLAAVAVCVLAIPSTVHAQRGGHAAKGHRKGAGGHVPGAGSRTPARPPAPAATGNRVETPAARRNQTAANVNARGGIDARPLGAAGAVGGAALLYAAENDDDDPPTTIQVNPGASGATSGSGLTPAQSKNVDGLHKELGEIRPGTSATPEQTRSLENRLNSMAQGSARSPWSRSLAEDLSGAATRGTMTPGARLRLARGLHTVMNGESFQPAEVESAMNDVRSALANSKVPPEDAQRIMARLKSISAEAKPGPQPSAVKGSGP